MPTTQQVRESQPAYWDGFHAGRRAGRDRTWCVQYQYLIGHMRCVVEYDDDMHYLAGFWHGILDVRAAAVATGAFG